jgi:hypothetical protein
MKNELPSNRIRRSLDVIAGILIACAGIGGCAKPSTIQESKTEAKSYEWRLTDSDAVVVAMAHQEWSDSGWKMKFYEPKTVPATDRKFRFEAIEEHLAKRAKVKATDLSSTGVTVNPDDTPSKVCDRLSEKGYHGRLVVIKTGSREMFGIGLSTGEIQVTADIWDISQKRQDYHNHAECTKTTPILWVIHFYKLSGELNDDGKLAFRSALEKALL